MEKNGNATELYVQRKVSDIVQERDRLKADLDEAQKLNKEMADNKEANKETLRMLNKIDNDLALRNSAVKQPTLAGQWPDRYSCYNFIYSFSMFSFSGEGWVAAALTAAFPGPARVEILQGQNNCETSLLKLMAEG